MFEDSAVIFKQTFPSKYLLESLVQEKNNPHNVMLVVNDSKLACHKSILVAVSPYFKAMFSSNMKESLQDEITLNEIDYNALAAVINYFYESEIQAMRFWINYDIESRHKYLPQLFKMLEVDKIISWVPLDIDKYLISYGIIDKDITEWLSLKQKSDSIKTSRKKTPLEICFAIGGYTFDSGEDCITLCSVEALYEREKWQFIRPHCLQSSGFSLFKYEKDTISTMTHCRSFPAIACTDKLIYVLGGNNGSGPINHAECYDPVMNKWETLPPLPCSLEGSAAVYMNKRVYLAGGYNQNIGINNKVWVYDEGCKFWRESVSMLHKRSHHCLVAVHGVLYAIGGSGEYGNALSSVECFYVGLDKWIEASSLLIPRSHFACVVYGDTIFSVCGKNPITLDTIERYDVTSDQWQLFSKFIGTRYGHAVSVFQNRLLIIGGRNNCLKASDSVHKLNLNASTSIWHETNNNLIRSRVGLGTATMKLY